MSAGIAWLDAFPLNQAKNAVDALVESWKHFASVSRPGFHHRIPEPRLTRVIRDYTRKVTAPQRRLLGYWGTEGVENVVDYDTAEVLDERRTDISYSWNNASTQIVLIFEFKKLSASSRAYYLKEGVMRFVSGNYSVKEPIAVMVGIVMARDPKIVEALKRSIQNPRVAGDLRACADGDGRYVLEPSILFPDHATFDTEHLRSEDKAPAHGTIRIGHIFVDFAFDPPTPATRRVRVVDAIEAATHESE
ncbi:MAG: hypothetical protein ACYC9P_02625 [Rudaea sp.]|jgi:hypothetical protein